MGLGDLRRSFHLRLQLLVNSFLTHALACRSPLAYGQLGYPNPAVKTVSSRVRKLRLPAFLDLGDSPIIGKNAGRVQGIIRGWSAKNHWLGLMYRATLNRNCWE
jgi:hypothetical protein